MNEGMLEEWNEYQMLSAKLKASLLLDRGNKGLKNG